MCQKVVQKCSRAKGSRGRTEKWQRTSKSPWFETRAKVKLFFLDLLLTIKILVQRSKKRVARGPPNFARRDPLEPSWRRLLRTMERSFHLSRGLVKKTWTPCERASKIIGVPGPNGFWNLLWTGEKSVQRGPSHTEWRTPWFSIVAPLSRFGRRVLRTTLVQRSKKLAAPFQRKGGVRSTLLLWTASLNRNWMVLQDFQNIHQFVLSHFNSMKSHVSFMNFMVFM